MFGLGKRRGRTVEARAARKILQHRNTALIFEGKKLRPPRPRETEASIINAFHEDAVTLTMLVLNMPLGGEEVRKDPKA